LKDVTYRTCTSDITCCRGSHHNLCWFSWTRCVERILPVL